MMDQEALGGHIQYEVGIMLDDQQKEFWNSYTAENREKFFWLFLNSFVEKWECKVIPTWELLVTSRLSGGKEMGPQLKKLLSTEQVSLCWQRLH